ncbi:MAG: hypothetical protein NXI18_19920 [Alphaproteobacteria bacterium]|nr:hypothetical protein [Alphaproteobacteria bacterium]
MRRHTKPSRKSLKIAAATLLAGTLLLPTARPAMADPNDQGDGRPSVSKGGGGFSLPWLNQGTPAQPAADPVAVPPAFTGAVIDPMDHARTCAALLEEWRGLGRREAWLERRTKALLTTV